MPDGVLEILMSARSGQLPHSPALRQVNIGDEPFIPIIDTLQGHKLPVASGYTGS